MRTEAGPEQETKRCRIAEYFKQLVQKAGIKA